MAEGIVAMERGLSLNLEYAGQTVRMVGTPERPEWVAADVCRVLGIANAPQAIQRFRQSEKGICQVYTPGGPQEMLTVTEPGFYRLVLRSDKPEAERFRDWVTHEVLPTIRRHGCYPAPDFEAGAKVIVTIDEQALGRAIGQHMGMLGAKIESVASDLTVVKTDVASLKAEVSRISRRKDLTKVTKRTHLYTIHRKFHGYCPCCNHTLIVGETGQALTTLHFEHFHGNGENSVEKTWAVCDKCNRDLERQEVREKHRKTFDVYQERRRALQREINPFFPGFDDLE